MRIGIDAHVLGSRAGGNETYMRALLKAMHTHAPETDLCAFISPERRTHASPAYGFPTVPIPVRSSYLRVPLVLPWLAARHGVDVLHVQYTAPPYCPCPYVVSMHDVVVKRFPESMPFGDRNRLRLLSRHTLRRAARVFVLTDAMRREISETYGVPAERCDLVQPFRDPLFVPITDSERLAAARQKYKLPEQYILYVGQVQPRKNLVRVAQACARLRDHGLATPLVIVGRRAWLYGPMLEAIQALDLGDRIQFTGYVDREDLPVLYSGAALFAYISEYEGFGIPVLEALACGTPVLASTDPALLEVAGGEQSAACHVSPYDVDAIEEALVRLLTDTELRADLAARGPQRAAHFTPARTAQAALDGYAKAAP